MQLLRYMENSAAENAKTEGIVLGKAETLLMILESKGKVAVRGVTGLAYSVDAHANALYLTIAGTREPTTDVVWTGEESATWNYKDKNFSVEGLPATFVADDAVIFNDDAKIRIIIDNTNFSARKIMQKNGIL